MTHFILRSAELLYRSPSNVKKQSFGEIIVSSIGLLFNLGCISRLLCFVDCVHYLSLLLMQLIDLFSDCDFNHFTFFNSTISYHLAVFNINIKYVCSFCWESVGESGSA